MARSGKLGVSRSMMERAAAELPLEALGLLHHLWSDLRWTPARKIIQGWAWDIRAGQAVVFIAAYAEKFRTSRRRITALLDQLVAGGWFAVEKTHRGCLLTCLRDPRDEDDGGPGPGGGGCNAVTQPPLPAPAPAEPGGVESPCSNPVASWRCNNCSTPGCSTPPRAAVKIPGSCKTGARAPEKAVAGPPGPVVPAVPAVPAPAPSPPILALAGRQLALAAKPAGVQLGLVAGLLLEHPGREAEVLAWLLTIATRNSELGTRNSELGAGFASPVPRSALPVPRSPFRAPRSALRCPPAFLRWALARAKAPPGADHDAAKRLLRAPERLPAGSTAASHWALGLVRQLAASLSTSSTRSTASTPAWVNRRAELAAAAAAECARLERRLARLRGVA